MVSSLVRVASGPDKPHYVPLIADRPLGVVLLGPSFAGKRTQSEYLLLRHGLKPLIMDTLVKEAVASLSDLSRPESATLKSPAQLDSSRKDKEKRGKLKFDVTPEHTPLQQLGVKISALLSKGQPLSDDLYVQLAVEAIHRTVSAIQRSAATSPASSSHVVDGGWCLVGFPETKAQAVLLEKALSGFELPKPRKSGAPKVDKEKEKGKLPSNQRPGSQENKAERASRLARPPSPSQQSEALPSGIDLVALFLN